MDNVRIDIFAAMINPVLIVELDQEMIGLCIFGIVEQCAFPAGLNGHSIFLAGNSINCNIEAVFEKAFQLPRRGEDTRHAERLRRTQPNPVVGAIKPSRKQPLAIDWMNSTASFLRLSIVIVEPLTLGF